MAVLNPALGYEGGDTDLWQRFLKYWKAKTIRSPRKYTEQDYLDWLNATGFFDQPGVQDALTPPADPSTTVDKEYTYEKFLALVNQIDPKNWWEDYKRFKPQFDAWGVKPQIASDGSFRGRFELPGGGSYDPFKEGLWGPRPGYEGGGGSESSDVPQFSYPEWTQSFQFEPWTRDFTFTAPTQQDLENDPIFKERIAAASKAIQTSAAARGSLLGPGMLKALQKSSQGIASEEGDRLYRRALGEQLTDYNLDHESYLNRQDQRLQEYGLQYGAFSDNRAAAERAFGINRGVYNDLFGQNFSLASLSLQAQRDSDASFQAMINAILNGTTAGNASNSANANTSAASTASQANTNTSTTSNIAQIIADYYARRGRSSYSPYGPYSSGYQF